jgi:hypothetical protein
MPKFKLPARFGSRDRRLTLLGRAVFLVIAELVANAACWTAAALCLPKSLLGLALLAWVSGPLSGCYASATTDLLVRPLDCVTVSLGVYRPELHPMYRKNELNR